VTPSGRNGTNIPEEPAASIFRVQGCSLDLQLHQKRCYRSTGQHLIRSRKSEILKLYSEDGIFVETSVHIYQKTAVPIFILFIDYMLIALLFVVYMKLQPTVAFSTLKMSCYLAQLIAVWKCSIKGLSFSTRDWYCPEDAICNKSVNLHSILECTHFAPAFSLPRTFEHAFDCTSVYTSSSSETSRFRLIGLFRPQD
jgi:hypothetical protein